MSWCHIYYITSVILYIYSGFVTASEYYVSAAPNGVSCSRTNRLCRDLSYYNADNASYFTNDVIFYFLEGTHTLQGMLYISNVSNITLQGLGHIEKGFDETIMESTSVIRCSDNNGTGIQFISSGNIAIISLTVANCGFDIFNIDHKIPYSPCGFYWYPRHRVSLFFVDINNVTLEYVSVQNSSGDGLVLVNVYDVLIDNSSFANNGATKTFAGNVLIVYDDQIKRTSKVIISKSNFSIGTGYGMYMWCDDDADVIIENSTFSNNIVCSGGGVEIVLNGGGSIEFSNCILFNNTARYGGGGVDIYSNGISSIEFTNCIIYNNTAKYYGGGVYIHSFTEGVSIEFLNCNIYNNIAHYDGGGVYIDLFTNNGNVMFTNCTIYRNSAQNYGGGIYSYLYTESGRNEFYNCTISNNTASFAAGLILRSDQANSTSSFLFRNVLIQFNAVINVLDINQEHYRSAVVLININDITFDKIDVSNHNTTGLVAENSLITFHGHNMFVNNSGIYGGGIALYESSQLIINQYVNISFINNHASVSGGGIFVSQILGVDNTTECSFKVIPYHYPNNTKSVLYFINNTADISGDVLYGGKIDDCKSTLYFDHLFHYLQQTGLSVVSSDPIQVCFCESNRPNCSITNVSIFATPGIDVNISLATVGLRKGLTTGVIKMTSSNSSTTVQTYNNRLNTTCTNVTFTLRTNPLLKTTEVYAKLDRSISKFLHDSHTKIIEVTIESCQNGYPFLNGACVCGWELNILPIKCDNKTLIITREDGMWIGYENDSNCLIVYRKQCPFHYCNKSNISFTLDYYYKQCLQNRSGILCGECSKGFSLTLGYNQCEYCENKHLALIIPFALAGIALVAFVIVLNLTVSVGTINGLIFYANVVKIYEHIFFPDGPIPFLSQFISWVNLDLGINTCFYDGMDSCSKAWLQFVFPAYIWFILILIIILLRYSSRMVRLIGRQIIPVIATMILLSYTKLIRTVVQALYFIKIPCTDEKKNETLLRWYFDANVHYLKGCHLSLFLFSLAVLILLIIPYTIYLLTIPLFEGPLSKYMCYFQKFSTYMKPFFDAYGGPYKDKFRFWTGFLLLVRVVLALTVSLNTETTVSLDLLTSLLIIIVFTYLILKGIYRHFSLVCLEEFFVLNLIFMAYMNAESSNDNDNSKGQVSSIVLVSISLVVFCGIIFYHIWDRLIFYGVRDRLLKSRFQQPITKVRRSFKKPPPTSTSNNMELPSVHSVSPVVEKTSSAMSMASVEMRRESMLFDQND